MDIQKPRTNIIETLESFLKAGEDIEERNSWDYRSLRDVILWSDNSIIEELLQNGKKNRKNFKDGETKLTYAVLCGDDDKDEIVRQLIVSRVDINKPNKYGRTALMYAAIMEEYEIASLLIAANAQVNAQDPNGYTALMYAAFFGRDEIVYLLLEAGADISIQNNHGKTALVHAESLGEDGTSLVIELLQPTSGQNCINRQKEGNYTTLMHAATYGYDTVIRLLLKAGANINAQNEQGYTALMYAVFYSKKNTTVQLLLTAGADVNMQNKEGMTALTFATKYGGTEAIVQLLLEAGADVNMQNKDEK